MNDQNDITPMVIDLGANRRGERERERELVSSVRGRYQNDSKTNVWW